KKTHVHNAGLDNRRHNVRAISQRTNLGAGKPDRSADKPCKPTTGHQAMQDNKAAALPAVTLRDRNGGRDVLQHRELAGSVATGQILIWIRAGVEIGLGGSRLDGVPDWSSDYVW